MLVIAGADRIVKLAVAAALLLYPVATATASTVSALVTVNGELYSVPLVAAGVVPLVV
jgi:hypothetical protein